jgi:hypothetical protein
MRLLADNPRIGPARPDIAKEPGYHPVGNYLRLYSELVRTGRVTDNLCSSIGNMSKAPKRWVASTAAMAANARLHGLRLKMADAVDSAVTTDPFMCCRLAVSEGRRAIAIAVDQYYSAVHLGHCGCYRPT